MTVIFLVTIIVCVSFVVPLKFGRPRARDSSTKRMIESDQIRGALDEFIGEKRTYIYRVKRSWRGDRFSGTFSQAGRHKNGPYTKLGGIRNVDLYMIPEDVAYTRLVHAVIWEREKERHLQLRDVTFLDGGAGECRSAAFTNDGIIPLGLTSPKYEDYFIQNVLKNPFDEQFRRRTKNRLLRFNKETFMSYQNSSEYIYVVHVDRSLSLHVYMQLDRYHLDNNKSVTKLMNMKIRPSELSPLYPLARPTKAICVTSKIGNSTVRANISGNATVRPDMSRNSTVCPDLVYNIPVNCTEPEYPMGPAEIPDDLVEVHIWSSPTGDVSIEVNTVTTIKCHVQYHRSLYDEIDVEWYRDMKPIDLLQMDNQLDVNTTKYKVTNVATSALKIGPVTCEQDMATYWCAFNLKRTNSSVIENYTTSDARIIISLADNSEQSPTLSFEPQFKLPGGLVDITCTGQVGRPPRKMRMSVQDTDESKVEYLHIKRRQFGPVPKTPCSTSETIISSYMFKTNASDYNVTCEIIGGGNNTRMMLDSPKSSGDQPVSTDVIYTAAIISSILAVVIIVVGILFVRKTIYGRISPR